MDWLACRDISMLYPAATGTFRREMSSSELKWQISTNKAGRMFAVGKQLF
jgi:hypothetical protein